MNWVNIVRKAYKWHKSASIECLSASSSGTGDSLADVYFHIWQALETKHTSKMRISGDARVIIKAAAGIEQDWRDTYPTYHKLSVLLGGNVLKWLELYGDWHVGKRRTSGEYAKMVGGHQSNYRHPVNRHHKKFAIIDELVKEAVEDIMLIHQEVEAYNKTIDCHEMTI